MRDDRFRARMGVNGGGAEDGSPESAEYSESFARE
jgi:hypothetical protein